MSLNVFKIENKLSYILNPKKAKRTSHKFEKKCRNKKIRRSKDLLEYKKYFDFEY